MKKIYLIVTLFVTMSLTAQNEGYNESYQLKKINSELSKYYDKSNSTKYFYELMSIKNDTLRVKKFSYLPGNQRVHVWDELYVPMNEIDVSSIKYKKGILINTKGKNKIIGDYLNTKPNAKKYYGFKIHPQAGKKKDKEIMLLISELFINYK